MRFRVWDPGNEDEASGKLLPAEGPEEAAEKYLEHMSTEDSLESSEYEVSVRPLEGAAREPVKVKVTVDWEPCFYGEVIR